MHAYRVYQANAPDLIEGGHRPRRWYYRPQGQHSRRPQSPGYETAEEAQAAAVDARARAAQAARVNDSLSRYVFDPASLNRNHEFEAFA